MSIALKRRLLTEEEYLLVERQADQRSEFVQGEMFAMAGATDQHETIAGNCFGLLWQELSKRGCKVYKGDMKVKVAATGRYAYPDVVVVCGERKFADERKDVLLNPTLLIEVLSDSTANYVRGDKGRDYRFIESLRELVIVAQDQPYVDLYVRQDKTRWNMSSVAGIEAMIDFPSIDCQLSLKDIYAGVELRSKPALRVAEESGE